MDWQYVKRLRWSMDGVCDRLETSKWPVQSKWVSKGNRIRYEIEWGKEFCRRVFTTERIPIGVKRSLKLQREQIFPRLIHSITRQFIISFAKLLATEHLSPLRWNDGSACILAGFFWWRQRWWGFGKCIENKDHSDYQEQQCHTKRVYRHYFIEHSSGIRYLLPLHPTS